MHLSTYILLSKDYPKAKYLKTSTIFCLMIPCNRNVISA